MAMSGRCHHFMGLLSKIRMSSHPESKTLTLVADLFLYYYERDFMDSLNYDYIADVIEAFNSTSRYLDDLLNIDNGMVNPALQLNKTSTTDAQSPFLDLHLSISSGFD